MNPSLSFTPRIHRWSIVSYRVLCCSCCVFVCVACFSSYSIVLVVSCVVLFVLCVCVCDGFPSYSITLVVLCVVLFLVFGLTHLCVWPVSLFTGGRCVLGRWADRVKRMCLPIWAVLGAHYCRRWPRATSAQVCVHYCLYIYTYIHMVFILYYVSYIALNACVFRSGLHAVRITVDGAEMPLTHRCARYGGRRAGA